MNWRDQILREFTPQVARLTIVADPDGLLLEEAMMQRLKERDFALMIFEDNISFRFAYESQHRMAWEKGNGPDLIIVLQASSSQMDSLPYDLLNAGRRLSFNISSIFPSMSYPVIAELDRAEFDKLFVVQQQFKPGMMGDNATRDFVLRHVYAIAPELIKEPVDLLNVLLRRHYQGQRLPNSLDERFISLMRQSGQFVEWPLEAIIPDRDAFFRFLQDRWPYFIAEWWKKQAWLANTPLPMIEELSPIPASNLPFDHDDVRVYIDNLFTEGFLNSIDLREYEELGLCVGFQPQWFEVGIRIDEGAAAVSRVERLLKILRESLPSADSRYQAWLAYAQKWAELLFVWHQLPAKNQMQLSPAFQSLRDQMDENFSGWVDNRYGSLYNLPASSPVMLHHLPRYLSREIEEGRMQKAALIVMDGMALDQWLVLREALTRQMPDHSFHEGAVFAWLPTITSVSRQAIFAAKPPLFFPTTINTTAKEPALWTQFWVEQGLNRREIGYLKGLGDELSVNDLDSLLAKGEVRIIGLVIDKIDRIMHGMELGAAGMHNQIRQWAEQGTMTRILRKLNENGFGLTISSDHGNIESIGCGKPQEGAIAEIRGERVRVYPNQTLRSQVKARFSDAVELNLATLPSDYCALLANHRKAFITEGERLVGHGGATIEELIVPFIQVEPLIA